MTTEAVAAKSSSAVRALNSRLSALLSVAGRVLSFSLADDRVTLRRGLCVSIEKGSLAVAAGSRFLSRISVRAAKFFPVDPSAYPAPEECASSVAMLLAESPMKKPVVSLSVPKAWTIATVAEFPATIKENMHDAMRHELDRLTPFSADEALYDFRILGEAGGKLSVLVLAAKASVVLPYLDALKDKGIAVSCVTSHSSSLAAFCGFSSGLRDCIVLRDREDDCEGTLLLDGAVRSVFTVRKSEAAPAQPDPSLLAELAAYSALIREYGSEPRIVLSSETAGPAVRDLLSQKTGVPVIPAEDMMRKDRMLHQNGGPILPAYSGLIELLWPKARPLDLLSRGIEKRERTPLLLTVVLACAVIAASAVYLYAPLEFEKRRSAEIDRMIAARKDDVRKTEDLRKQVESLAAEISTINAFRKKPLTVNIVREVTAVLPNSAWLTRLRVSDTEVNIEGFASSATELIPKLEASKLLSSAELASATYRDQRANMDRFVIKADIEGAKKEEKAAVAKPGEAKHEKK